ncbi:MAG: hypothetical protein AAB568_02125 [Patescibacteria group bacterium]
MKKVEIYKLDSDGTQSVIAVCNLAGDKAICEGDVNLVANLEREGVRNYTGSTPEQLYPKDGLEFLKQLKHAFKSGYLNASDIIE